MSIFSRAFLKISEMGILPDKLIKLYVNHLLRRALELASLGDIEAKHSVFRRIINDIKLNGMQRDVSLPIDEFPEMEFDFYKLFLGKNLLNISAYFATGLESHNEAEETMLWMICDRAEIKSGINVLVLGSVFGALSFWIADRFPDVQITILTRSLKKEIQLKKVIKEKGYKNINVKAALFEDYEPNDKFDRVISLATFDSIFAYPKWDEKIANMLTENGQFFFQLPVHSQNSYFYDFVGLKDLPGRVISREVLVPSAEYFLLFQQHFFAKDTWKISGEHYSKTAQAWLEKFDENSPNILSRIEKALGKKHSWIWLQRYRQYLISIVEQYSINRGQEWIICQYLFKKR